MLTFFIHFGLFAMPIIGFQAGFYSAPSPTPQPSSYHFLMVLSLGQVLYYQQSAYRHMCVQR